MAQQVPAYRKMIAKFLTAYRNEPCLWNPENKFYHNKKIRLVAVDKLLEIVRTVEPDAERCDVLRKINCLRTTYRKERRKVEASLQFDEEARKPTLWYYHMLSFLDDPIDVDDDGNNEPQSIYLEKDEEAEHEEVSFVNANSPCKEEYLESESEGSQDNLIIPSTSRQNLSETKSVSNLATKRRRRKVEESNLTNKVVNLLNDCIKRPKVDTEKEDRHDVFCKSIAMKLRYLDNHQRIIAEKLINDVMFEAELGNLNTDFKIARGD